MFCGAFYLVTVMVGGMEGERGNDNTDFSPARKRANTEVFRKDWWAARVEFKTLTEQDPFNGYAWDGYATSIWKIRGNTIDELVNLDKSNAQNADQENELRQQIDDLNDQAREIHLRLKKFSRYRYSALLRLAVVECDRGDYDEAMDFLEEFVGRGYSTSRGLQWIEKFGSGGQPIVMKYGSGAAPPFSRLGSINNTEISQFTIPTATNARLHLEPRFWDIVRREGEIHLKY